jgi:hypothetical protein
VLEAKEVDMQPHIAQTSPGCVGKLCIAIVVRGGVVQEVVSNTPNLLIKLLDMDAIDEGDPPDQWRPPDVVINNSQDFEASTSTTQTP